VRQTTGNAIVPLSSGLARDQGVPQEYVGQIKDLCPEISHLYALTSGPTGATAAITYSAQLEAAGTGNGQFSTDNGPYGVAINAAGTSIAVADRGNHRIQLLNASLVYQSQFGSSGSGNDNFSSPDQVAIDQTSGDIWIADTGNNRVKRHSSAGTYEAEITGLTGVTGVAVDADGNIYANKVSSGSSYSLLKYNSSLVLQWDTGDAIGPASFTWTNVRHLAVDATNLYFTSGDSVAYFPHASEPTSSGSSFGSTGTGDGQFNTPYGIAVNPLTGNLFVVDQGNDRVQQFTTTGTFVSAFGSSGTGTGQFALATGIAVAAAGTFLVVGDETEENVQKFLIDTDVAQTAYPLLTAWPGTGWHALWKGGDNTKNPTWAVVSAPTTHYRLWWGMDDGYAYYLKLFRGFENPNQARIAQSATFAASGELLTSKFDAGMLGFDKVASHVVCTPIQDSITADETFTVEFSIDDGGWEELGTVDDTTLDAETNEAHLFFGDAGRVFRTIRFRLSAARGSTTTRSPFLRAMTLLFVKVPQQARSFVFTIAPSAKEVGMFPNRTAFDMFGEIDDLASLRTFFDVEYNGQTFEHCRFAGATGFDGIAENAGKRVISIIQLPVASA
jgi:DNA-binding beta-propeller fold protein YncE